LNRLKRIGYWTGAAVFSLGLATLLAITGVIIADSMGGYRNQKLLGAGIGLFTFIILWPGILTACLMIADGIVTSGVTKQLAINTAVWASVPPLFIAGLLKAGISWIMVGHEMLEGGPLGGTIGIALFLAPSLLCAYLGRRLEWPVKRNA